MKIAPKEVIHVLAIATIFAENDRVLWLDPN